MSFGAWILHLVRVNLHPVGSGYTGCSGCGFEEPLPPRPNPKDGSLRTEDATPLDAFVCLDEGLCQGDLGILDTGLDGGSRDADILDRSDVTPVDHDGDGFDAFIDCDDEDKYTFPLRHKSLNPIFSNTILCPGTYEEARLDVTRDGVTIHAEGVILNTVDNVAVDFSHRQGVTLTGLSVLDFATRPPHPRSIVFQMVGASENTISGCRLRLGSGAALLIQAGHENIFRDCLIEGRYEPTVDATIEIINGNRNHIEGIVLNHCEGFGIRLDENSTGNIIDQVNGNFLWTGIEIFGDFNSVANSHVHDAAICLNIHGQHNEIFGNDLSHCFNFPACHVNSCRRNRF